MYTIDRIENKLAILEDRNTLKIIEVELSKLPNNIKEGDIIDLINNKYILNDKKTKKTKKIINKLFDSLKE